MKKLLILSLIAAQYAFAASESDLFAPAPYQERSKEEITKLQSSLINIVLEEQSEEIPDVIIPVYQFNTLMKNFEEESDTYKKKKENVLDLLTIIQNTNLSDRTARIEYLATIQGTVLFRAFSMTLKQMAGIDIESLEEEDDKEFVKNRLKTIAIEMKDDVGDMQKVEHAIRIVEKAHAYQTKHNIPTIELKNFSELFKLHMLKNKQKYVSHRICLMTGKKPDVPAPTQDDSAIPEKKITAEDMKELIDIYLKQLQIKMNEVVAEKIV